MQEKGADDAGHVQGRVTDDDVLQEALVYHSFWCFFNGETVDEQTKQEHLKNERPDALQNDPIELLGAIRAQEGDIANAVNVGLEHDFVHCGITLDFVLDSLLFFFVHEDIDEDIHLGFADEVVEDEQLSCLFVRLILDLVFLLLEPVLLIDESMSPLKLLLTILL